MHKIHCWKYSLYLFFAILFLMIVGIPLMFYCYSYASESKIFDNLSVKCPLVKDCIDECNDGANLYSSRKGSSFIDDSLISSNAYSYSATGKIIDGNGNPIEHGWVQFQVDGATKGVYSDNSGNFNISFETQNESYELRALLIHNCPDKLYYTYLYIDDSTETISTNKNFGTIKVPFVCGVYNIINGVSRAEGAQYGIWYLNDKPLSNSQYSTSYHFNKGSYEIENNTITINTDETIFGPTKKDVFKFVPSEGYIFEKFVTAQKNNIDEIRLEGGQLTFDAIIKADEPPIKDSAILYRAYNPNSGEHFYTSSAGERDYLANVGWIYEGIAWKSPIKSNSPVYRLYNPNSGDHHYTTSGGERQQLVSVGWRDEGIGWYSDDAKKAPVYRQYNPNAFCGSHNFTISKSENDWLVQLGWKAEGIAWYAAG